MEAEVQTTPATLSNALRCRYGGEGGVPCGMLRKPWLQRFCCFQPRGKIFCAGSHLGRIITHFHEVLDSRPSPTLLPTPSPCGPSQALTQPN